MVINARQMKTVTVDKLRDGVGKTEIITLIEKEDFIHLPFTPAIPSYGL